MQEAHFISSMIIIIPLSIGGIASCVLWKCDLLWLDRVAAHGNEEAPHALADGVEDQVHDDSSVEADSAGALVQDPCDGVATPEDSSEPCSLGVHASVPGIDVSLERAVEEQVEEDGAEHEHGEGEEHPAGALTALEGADEASDNHEHVDSHDVKEGLQLRLGTMSEEDEVDKHEWGGEGPVDVASEEELLLVDHGGTIAHGHGEVCEGGNAVNGHGEVLELALARWLGSRLAPEDEHGNEHAAKGDPEADAARGAHARDISTCTDFFDIFGVLVRHLATPPC